MSVIIRRRLRTVIRFFFAASIDSHTGEFLSSKFYERIQRAGTHKTGAIVFDNASNMVKARSPALKNEDCKHILNIRCFMRAFGVTMESIMGHSQIKSVAALCQKIVTHIRASHYTLAKLQQQLRPPKLSGLKASNTTRLVSVSLY
jgi:hypothetical protein